MPLAYIKYQGPHNILGLWHLTEDESASYCEEVEARLGLPSLDPFRHGADRLAAALQAL